MSFIAKTIHRSIIALSVAAPFISGASAQNEDTLESPTVSAQQIVIDNVTVNGTDYNSVTITSEGPLTIAYGGGNQREHCQGRTVNFSSAHFGRNGPLTEREFQMAQVAWTYFESFHQDETGLVNAVGNYPSTTLWDTASYISALVSAYELCIINKQEFDTRATSLLNTLRNLPLFRGEAPNKVYHTQTGQPVNYANEEGEIGMSALDIGRMLVWLRILKERHPHLANSVDNVPMRWNFCNLVSDDGRMYGSFVQGDGETRYVQEGRLGYEEYAAKGFALWGFDVPRALSPEPLSYTTIYDVDVPYDGRDPRVFKNQNYVLTEGYILDGLEMGWDLPTDRTGDGLTASHGWRAEFANRIYLVQQRRYEQTGVITARSEHQVDGRPYFVYDTIFADGYAWNTLDPTGEYQPDRSAIAAKAAIGLWALWETDYTDLLFESVADLYDPERGFYEGLYENGNGFIPLQTANNNGIILAALLYKAQGPILQQTQENIQFWDTAFAGTDIRDNKCHPRQMEDVVNCCNCANADIPPVIPLEDFVLCRPVPTTSETAATDCGTERHAAFGVVLIHSTTDFGGKPFEHVDPTERLGPIVLRSIGEFSGSELFFMFSLFLMAMRVDRKHPAYVETITVQAKRLLVPFAFWVVFYAFFRLLKAEAFSYSDYIWTQVTDLSNWVDYFLLGTSQYHMHFLPTLFALLLFYPMMRGAARYPILGLTLFLTLGIMNNSQAFIWTLELDSTARNYILRVLKVLGYVGYGLAAFAFYGLWKDGIPRGESRLIRRFGFYLIVLAYTATLPFFATAWQTGEWGVRSGWDFYGHFLMPICIFLTFMGGQYLDWSAHWSNWAKYTFGVYLVHPAIIDLYDIALFQSGLHEPMSPTVIVLLRYAVALPGSFAISVLIAKTSLLAWTIGLGAPPWQRRPRSEGPT